MKENTCLSTWVDTRLISLLQGLRQRQPHAPPMLMIANLAVQLGLDALDAEAPVQLEEHAEPGGSRRSLTVRLPRHLYKRVVQVSKERPEASTLSSALHLVLWRGVAVLLEREGARGVAAVTGDNLPEQRVDAAQG